MNNWIEVQVPSGIPGQEMYYASVYAFLTNVKGMSVKKAQIIAEAAAMKRLYPGLVYSDMLEKDLKELNN